ncbi:MAG TPA: helix-turn-helix domain-containing protein [Bacteroidia bacterium]|nr:helix-turn-helix domain-containing protein [Bacteroidia bacterium]
MEKKQVLTTIANNVRTLMNQAGLSSTALARKCKISVGTISKIINGNMSITIPMAVTLAEGLGVDMDLLLKSLVVNKINDGDVKKPEPKKSEQFFIGILSINNKRYTCIKNYVGKIIGSSELEGGLDLAETTGSLIHLINESIYEALPNANSDRDKLKYARLNLVTQSYEFEDTRNRFVLFTKKYFKDVLLIPDWQITYLAAFKNEQGISLVTDKGVSLSYMHNESLRKLGGWKFPVYDLGGENWLGVETIRHTIEAAEGYSPMTKLAHTVLTKCSGKIEKITETCFKGTKDPDIYCLFTEILLRSYYTGDDAAKTIIESGFKAINRSIERVDNILGKQLRISINGSLADIYKEFFAKNRLIASSTDAEKVELLSDINEEFLIEHGVKIL